MRQGMFLKRDHVERMLTHFKSRYGHESAWSNIVIAALIGDDPFENVLSVTACSLQDCIPALLNINGFVMQLVSAREVPEIDKCDSWRLCEWSIKNYVDGINDLLEEARVAAATGSLPICGTWDGWDTVVTVRDFFTWAEVEGFFVPEAIRHAIDGPELYAARRKAEGADNGQIVAEMKERFNLPPSRIGDILRPGDYAPDAQRMWANRELAKWEAERK